MVLVSSDPDLLAGGMQALLSSELGKQLLNLRPTNLYDDLINDAYKPKMHKLYAHFMQDVRVDFCLNIRKTPVPLMIIQQQVRPGLSLTRSHCPGSSCCCRQSGSHAGSDCHNVQEPALFSEFQQRVNRLHLGIPLTPHIVAVLRQYYEFTVTSVRSTFSKGGHAQSWPSVQRHVLCS